MSPAESIARATQWLQDLVSELSGLRNATSRDPSFKNWRQNTITILQRIWPADQDHAERFRRIPFSPVDPRADVRAQRESFSRGCQEAARVLNSFIEEVRTVGVPEIPGDQVMVTEESGFEDGFPTVDLPSGDLSDTGWAQEQYDAGHQGRPPQGAAPSYPTQASPAPPAPSPSEARPARKGLGVAAKLRDLLGLGGFAAKPTPQQPPQENVGSSGAMPTALPRALDIIPVGDEVDARPRRASQPPANRPQPPTVPAAGARGQVPQQPQPQPPAAPSTPAAEPGMSVVMSRPTTLRSNIEKVSIESLISPEFRGGAEGGAGTGQPSQSPAAVTPQPPGARPPLSIVPPLAGDPEFNVDPAPAAGETPQHARTSGPSNVTPLPPEENEAEDAVEDESFSRADSAELTRATEDFMRSSPVLGATGRKVQRAPQEAAGHGFTDPDAIAIISIVDELTQLGVPTTRQSETRARLLDLSRRIETGELEWNSLKKSVWFAMEYPEVARRVMPLLLPWIDRAA